MRRLIAVVWAALAVTSCGGESKLYRSASADGSSGAGAGGVGVGGVGVGGVGVGGAGGVGGSSQGDAGRSVAETGGALSLPVPEICATTELTGMRHVDGYVFAIDRSLAMADGWSDVAQALLAFFADAHRQNVSVALRFFPDEEPVAGCNAESCNVSPCMAPLVSLAELTAEPAPLDAQEALLSEAIGKNVLTTEPAPVFTALEGALDAARSFEGDAQTMSVVLVTASEGDGRCGAPSRIPGYYLSLGIPTYVLAPATSNALGALDEIAMLGGTGSAIRIGLSDGTDQLSPLIPIREGTYSCDFDLPKPAGNPPLDYDSAIMTVSLDADEPFTPARVGRELECGSALAWYYQAVYPPSRITLCPSLCEEVTQNRDVDLVFSVPCGELPPP